MDMLLRHNVLYKPEIAEKMTCQHLSSTGYCHFPVVLVLVFSPLVVDTIKVDGRDCNGYLTIVAFFFELCVKQKL